MRREQIRSSDRSAADRRRTRQDHQAALAPLRHAPPPAEADRTDDLLDRIEALLGDHRPS